MPATPGPTPSTPYSYTVAQLFESKNLRQWWNYPSQHFGVNNERGTDFDMGFNTPVGAIAPGIVVFSGYAGTGAPGSANPGQSNCESIGYIVQIMGADGFYQYQHLNSPSVSKGAKVNVGDIVGMSGGLPKDTCSSGAHIEVRWIPNAPPNQNYPWFNGDSSFWINPLPHFLQIANQLAQVYAPGGAASGPGVQPVNALAPTAQVGALLATLDCLFSLTGIPTSWSSDNNALFGLGSVAGAIEGTISFAFGVVEAIAAITLRLIVGGLGVFILYKIFTKFVDVNTAISNVGNLGSTLGKAALLA